jgi:hypothetical protein
LENFLFKLSSAGVGLWRIKKRGQTLYFLASSANVKVIENAAEELSLELKIIDSYGLLKKIKKLPYYIGGLFGIIFWIVLCIVQTSSILWVEYPQDENHVCQNGENCIFLEDNFAEIKEYLAELGVFVGNKNNINIRSLNLSVMAKFNLVENCTVIKNGCKIVVKISEAAGQVEKTRVAIVAPQNCIIYSITTFSGVARVKAGDVVKQGDVLVEADGDIAPRAQILLQVYHTGMAIYNSNTQSLERTGKTQTVCSLSIFGKTYGDSSPQFSLYETEQQTSFVAPNLFLPIVFTKTTIYELRIAEKYVPFEDVRSQILAEAKQNAISQVCGTILECNYSIVTEGNLTRVDCYITSIEKLG